MGPRRNLVHRSAKPAPRLYERDILLNVTLGNPPDEHPDRAVLSVGGLVLGEQHLEGHLPPIESRLVHNGKCPAGMSGTKQMSSKICTLWGSAMARAGGWDTRLTAACSCPVDS